MENLRNKIDEVTAKYVDTFGELSQRQLNWKPDRDTWSIAQNIDHLIVINESYFPIIESVRNGTYKAPFTSRIGFLVSLFGKKLLDAVQPERKKKTRTFSIWEPSKSSISKDILNRFKIHQEKLKSLIYDSRDLVEKKVVISSPANKYIVYKLDKAFEIMVTHEQRHYEQAKEVLKFQVEQRANVM